MVTVTYLLFCHVTVIQLQLLLHSNLPTTVNLYSKVLQIHSNYQWYYDQRWSRGHKARGQGQGHKKIRGQGQGQPFRGQTLSRLRTGMLEAKAKDQEHKRMCSPKKKKKVFTKIFQAISTKKRFPKIFSSAPQNFNNSKTRAVLEPMTGQFSRTWGLEAKAKDFKMCPRGLHLWLRQIVVSCELPY